ncbi:MAG: helix-turn-helix domain-containing protein, partial [Selenomonadaceae bacterium]|nr:helix-turn-helix domain-containing protein [Selenomonadaceae bacterium]
MLQQKGYKYRIYPNKKQQNIINQTLGCSRFVYNRFL